jgi:hypothetical protein
MDDYRRARERIEVLEGSRETSHHALDAPASTSPLSHAGK